MVQISAPGVEDWLAALPQDRRAAMTAIRKTIRKHLPQGYREEMYGGMPAYVIPLELYPKTHNKKPLMLAGLASQKNHMSLHMVGAYVEPKIAAWLEGAYKAAGRKLDMGKGCLRFKALDEVPLEVIGAAITRLSVDDYIAIYEKSRAGKA